MKLLGPVFIVPLRSWEKRILYEVPQLKLYILFFTELYKRRTQIPQSGGQVVGRDSNSGYIDCESKALPQDHPFFSTLAA